MNMFVGFYIFYALLCLFIAIIRFRGALLGIKEEDREKYDIAAYCKFTGVITLIVAVLFAVFAVIAFGATADLNEHMFLISLFPLLLNISAILAERKFRIAPLSDKEKRNRRIMNGFMILFGVFIIVSFSILILR